MSFTDYLPDTGFYCVSPPNGKNAPGFSRFYDTKEKLELAVTDCTARNKQVWIPRATFVDTGLGRKKENVAWLRSLAIDVDLAKPGKEGFATGKEAYWRLVELMKAGDLMPASSIVVSGNGLHVWWRLDRDVDAATWTKISERHRDHILRVEPRLGGDTSRWADANGLLRPWPQVNTKDPAKTKRVGRTAYEGIGVHSARAVVSFLNGVYVRDGTITPPAKKTPTPKPSKARATTARNASILNEPRSQTPMADVLNACALLAAYDGHKAVANNTQWIAALHAATFMSEGKAAAHALSEGWVGEEGEITDYTVVSETYARLRSEYPAPPSCHTLRDKMGVELSAACLACPLYDASQADRVTVNFVKACRLKSSQLAINPRTVIAGAAPVHILETPEDLPPVPPGLKGRPVWVPLPDYFLTSGMHFIGDTVAGKVQANLPSGKKNAAPIKTWVPAVLNAFFPMATHTVDKAEYVVIARILARRMSESGTEEVLIEVHHALCNHFTAPNGGAVDRALNSAKCGVAWSGGVNAVETAVAVGDTFKKMIEPVYAAKRAEVTTVGMQGDGTYVYRYWRIAPDGGVTSVSNLSPALQMQIQGGDHKDAVGGTRTEYMDLFKEQVGHDTTGAFQFFACATIASQLAGMVGYRPVMIFNAHGDSGWRKTATLKLMTGMVGNPKDGYFDAGANHTENAMIAASVLRGDMVTVFDDMGKKLNKAEFIMALQSGEEKARANKDGTPRDRGAFMGAFLLSGNKRIDETIFESRGDNGEQLNENELNARRARVFEVDLDGVLYPGLSVEDGDAMARKWVGHHGWTISVVQWGMCNRTQMKRWFEEACEDVGAVLQAAGDGYDFPVDMRKLVTLLRLISRAAAMQVLAARVMDAVGMLPAGHLDKTIAHILRFLRLRAQVFVEASKADWPAIAAFRQAAFNGIIQHASSSSDRAEFTGRGGLIHALHMEAAEGDRPAQERIIIPLESLGAFLRRSNVKSGGSTSNDPVYSMVRSLTVTEPDDGRGTNKVVWYLLRAPAPSTDRRIPSEIQPFIHMHNVLKGARLQGDGQIDMPNAGAETPCIVVIAHNTPALAEMEEKRRGVDGLHSAVSKARAHLSVVSGRSPAAS